MMGVVSREAEAHHRDDHRDVQDRGAERGGEEAVVGVERAHRERGQPHEDEVRKQGAGQAHREGQQLGLRPPAGRHHGHHQGRDQGAETGDQAEHHDRRAGHRSREAPEGLGPLAAQASR